MQATHDFANTATHIVRSVAALPPLPAAAQEILQQFGDEFIEAAEVARVVERDPGICAKLLGLANSAFFNLSEPVTSMEEVVSRVLGVDTVRSLVFAMALQQTFNARHCPSFDAERYWLDALCVAESCKKLARSDEEATDTARNLAYPAGLCHNLGLLALVHIEPARTDQVLRAHADHPDTSRLTHRLVNEFGTDHRHTTVELAKLWSLPLPIVIAYGDRSKGADSQPDVRLSAMLDAAATAVGNANGPEEARIGLDRSAARLGLTAAELEKRAGLSAKQTDRLRSVASSMS